MITKSLEKLKALRNSFFGAVVFYTIIPLPLFCPLEFKRVARFAPLIGLLLGSLLALSDMLLNNIGIKSQPASVLVITLSICLTGGLHWDGAIDTADGLGASNREKRLQIMQDSLVGSFGVIAAVILILLLTTALASLEHYRGLALILSAAWGRWGQVLAISTYPYVKKEGKGAFHRDNLAFPQDICLGLIFVLIFSGFYLYLLPSSLNVILLGNLAGLIVAVGVNWGLSLPLQGHTGDTYGAVVCWTEALLMCCFTALE